ncbi:MAG TPA: tetratricopeptide repeat protein [Kofleriaceae bacterium]|nr:tetratricopeptide repeat protein [Kofleriaceae bacterium]
MTRDELIAHARDLLARGRADDAVGLLAQAVVDAPDPTVSAFLALALLDAGHPRAAVATLLGAALDSGAFAGHEAALGEHYRQLLAP